MELTLRQVAEFTGGQLFGDPDILLGGVQIDSRKVRPWDLFVALKGQQADGHSYVLACLETASAALVARDWAAINHASVPLGRGLIAVDNPQQALQELAKRYRERFAIPVIGVTGSTGKTSTKDMIAAVLSPEYRVHKSVGNFNNELGLPLSLLGLQPDHEVAVFEFGMRGLGEIALLASLAQPSIGVITNIGDTHLELLGSQANIAEAKGELLHALPSTGTAVLNGDDEWCRRLGSKLECQTIYYGFSENGSDLIAREIKPWGDLGTSFTAEFQGQLVAVKLPVPGRHNVANALAAIAVGIALGLELEACAVGFLQLEMSSMRFEVMAGMRESKIINDAYNANPTSTTAALQVLAERSQKHPKVAVLGSMFELGPQEEAGHRAVGEFAAGITGLTYLVTVGELAEFIASGAKAAGMPAARIFSFPEVAPAVEFLKDNLPEKAWVLVKGSRGMKMERIVAELIS